MRVSFFGLENGKDTPKGSITWSGSEFILDPPDSQLLASVLEDVIAVGDKRIMAKREPVQFLLALPLQYKSAYLRAKVDDEPA